MNSDLIFKLFYRKTSLPILMRVLRIFINERLEATRQAVAAAEGGNLEEQLRATYVSIQEVILEETVLNIYFARYPLPREYASRFLNLYIKLLEEVILQTDVYSECFNVEIYTIYVRFMQPASDYVRCDSTSGDSSSSSSSDNNSNNSSSNNSITLHERIDRLRLQDDDLEPAFVTHCVDRLRVPIIETNEIVAHGTTGFRTWPAALHLLQFMLNKTEPLEKRNNWARIIELGAGAGMLGIALRQAGFTTNKRYLFTDHSEALLDRIEDNIATNHLCSGAQLSSELLDWSEIDEMHLKSAFDLILASDVIFDPVVVVVLVKALRSLIVGYMENDVGRKFPQCFISAAVRNQELLTFFEQCLEKNGLRGEIVDRREQPVWVEAIHSEVAKCHESVRNDPAVASFLADLPTMDGDIVPTIIYSIEVANPEEVGKPKAVPDVEPTVEIVVNKADN